MNNAEPRLRPGAVVCCELLQCQFAACANATWWRACYAREQLSQGAENIARAIGRRAPCVARVTWLRMVVSHERIHTKHAPSHCGRDRH